jgi:hypothetical protein
MATLRKVNKMQAATIPDFLAHLPTHRGLPVPFVQAVFNGVPDFRTVDPNKSIQCIEEKLCAICGRKLGEKSYFIGGPRSKASRLFTDPPMHQKCAEFASQTCPFVSGRKSDYSDRPINPEIVKVEEMVSTHRPAQMFILTAWTKKIELVQNGQNILIHVGGTWIGQREIDT